jgi:hypothetical protein
MSSSTSSDTLLRIGIIVLTLGTALIHFSLNFPDPGFILAGLGYLTLLASLYLPVPYVTRYRPVVPWIFIGYTALVILLWVLLGARTAIGYTDKVIEIALILLLLIEVRGSRSSSR